MINALEALKERLTFLNPGTIEFDFTNPETKELSDDELTRDMISKLFMLRLDSDSKYKNVEMAFWIRPETNEVFCKVQYLNGSKYETLGKYSFGKEFGVDVIIDMVFQRMDEKLKSMIEEIDPPLEENKKETSNFLRGYKMTALEDIPAGETGKVLVRALVSKQDDKRKEKK